MGQCAIHTHSVIAMIHQVPLGKYAFMPGKLYHSNEILVLLGDNWFAKTTAKHAVGVAERRRQCGCV